MSRDRLRTVAETLVAYCRSGQEARGLDELYAPDAVSMESGPGPDGSSPETHGLDGIRGKHAWWKENFEVHAASAEGPFLHGTDRFAVIFEVEATHRPSGQRTSMREVAIYTLDGEGRIAREEFYNTP